MAEQNTQSDDKFQNELTEGNERAQIVFSADAEPNAFPARCPVCHKVISATVGAGEPDSVTGEVPLCALPGDSEPAGSAEVATARCPQCHQPSTVASHCPVCYRVPGGVPSDTETSATTARCTICNSFPGPTARDVQTFSTEDEAGTSASGVAETSASGVAETSASGVVETSASGGALTTTRDDSRTGHATAASSTRSAAQDSIETLSLNQSRRSESSMSTPISVRRYYRGETSPHPVTLALPGERMGRSPDHINAARGFSRTEPSDSIDLGIQGTYLLRSMGEAYQDDDRQAERRMERNARNANPDARRSLLHTMMLRLSENSNRLGCCGIVCCVGGLVGLVFGFIGYCLYRFMHGLPLFWERKD